LGVGFCINNFIFSCNSVGGSNGAFSAVSGYDYTTGLGSPNAPLLQNAVNAFFGTTSLAATQTTTVPAATLTTVVPVTVTTATATTINAATTTAAPVSKYFGNALVARATGTDPSTRTLAISNFTLPGATLKQINIYGSNAAVSQTIYFYILRPTSATAFKVVWTSGAVSENTCF
jgi:hypothetical protein